MSRPVASLGLPGVPWHPQILADQLTLSQPGGPDYDHHITTGTPGFSDLPTALLSQDVTTNFGAKIMPLDCSIGSNLFQVSKEYVLYFC